MTTQTVDKTATSQEGYTRLTLRRQELEQRLEELWRLVDTLKAQGKPYRSAEDRLLRLLRSYEKLCEVIDRYYPG